MKIQLTGTLDHIGRCEDEETGKHTGWIQVGADLDGAVSVEKPIDLKKVQDAFIAFQLKAVFGEQLKLGDKLYITISTDES